MSGKRHPMRWLAVAGAVLAAAAVGLAAYASHAATPDDRFRLLMAAAIAFGHGASLAALAPGNGRRVSAAALVAMFVGTLLFAGSLVAGALLEASTRLAPAGGMLLIAGWLLLAVERARS